MKDKGMPRSQQKRQDITFKFEFLEPTEFLHKHWYTHASR